MSLDGFTIADALAIGCFVVAWVFYYFAVERSSAGSVSLNRLMNRHRYRWMRVMAGRDNRIVDGNINASLQNGTAFFASTSLIAIGAALTLLRSSDEMMNIFSHLSLGAHTTRTAWEVKVLGLTIIFVYAFFKFAWSYRLFNYVAILIGAVPERNDENEEERMIAAWRAASMSTVAGRHFNRGQRAFFFALAYLGWFLGPYVLIVSTVFVVYTMWHRQFSSDSLLALSKGPWPDPP